MVITATRRGSRRRPSRNSISSLSATISTSCSSSHTIWRSKRALETLSGRHRDRTRDRGERWRASLRARPARAASNAAPEPARPVAPSTRRKPAPASRQGGESRAGASDGLGRFGAGRARAHGSSCRQGGQRRRRAGGSAENRQVGEQAGTHRPHFRETRLVGPVFGKRAAGAHFRVRGSSRAGKRALSNRSRGSSGDGTFAPGLIRFPALIRSIPAM